MHSGRGAPVAPLAAAILLACIAPDVHAQEEPPNTMTLAVGRSRDVSGEHGGDFTRAIGVDYMRLLTGRWELGVQLDVDFDREDSGADALLVTPVVSYAITERWPVFAGAGIVFEGEHATGFARVGSEYTFPLDRRGRWFVAPGVFLDVAAQATPSVMVALGHKF